MSDSRATSRASNVSVPADGASTQPSMCSSVDLPQPEGPRTATYIALADLQRHVAHGGDGARRHRRTPGDVRGIDDDAAHEITSFRSVAAIGSRATMLHRIERGDDRGDDEQREMDDQRAGLEDEEMQVRGDVRQRLRM